jgi:hypothetical protein
MKHFFAEEALRQLSAMGDPLEKLDACIDWEIFRAPIETGIIHGSKKGEMCSPLRDEHSVAEGEEAIAGFNGGSVGV